MSNVITATFNSGETSAITTSQYQWETGQVLQFSGIDLPATYRVNISNSYHGTSKTQIGTSDGVSIPDVYFATGKYIYVWVVTTYDDDNAEIEYSVTIPIIKTSRPEEYDPDEETETIINQAISALSTALSSFETTTAEFESAITKLNTMTFSINDTGELIYTYDDGGE